MTFSYHEQLAVIQSLQKYKTSSLDSIFKIIHQMDSTSYYLMLGGCVLYMSTHRNGMKALYMIMFVATTNYILKNIFQHPRPFILDPDVAVVTMNSKFGLPSGAATGSVIIGYLISRLVKGTKGIILGFTYFSLLSFSRIYLGVHFFTDIIAGWIIGLISIFLYIKSEKKIGLWIDQTSLITSYLAAVLLICILTLPFIGFPNTYKYTVLTIGFTTGTFLYHLFKPKDINQSITVKITWFIMSSAIFVTLYKLNIAGGFFAGVWLTGVALILRDKTHRELQTN